MYKRNIPQVFVADDFFGRTEYHPERVSKWQDDLPLVLPKLNVRHWLILTSRAHLLKMGKAQLDVSGENDRFPQLGEVIVNAGNLTRTEKARILYRHAKAASLSDQAKTVVQKFARQIIDNRHFTPERIRRLVSDIVPRLAGEKLSPDLLPAAIDEALANPTREMRISFRSLPAPHRWLLFSLLEVDEMTRGNSDALRTRYEEICPEKDQIPYHKVILELTEAFIKRLDLAWTGDHVQWIHPSGRDLAIEELAAIPPDRGHFLENCSAVGVELATSLAGGAHGERRLPLVATEHDWRRLHRRSKELIESGVRLVNAIWRNLKAIESEQEERTAQNNAQLAV
jgi:conflict system STAND superfamily ATPase